jgi:hypothetical protein
MTLIRGGPAGPDGLGGAYDNEVETDRSAWWYALGGRQAVIKGFVHSGVAGSMALDFTAGAALVGERAADGTASLDRGYLVWEDAVTRVTFGPAAAAARNHAGVAAFVDVEDGAVGTGGLDVGPHLVVVPGVSGTTTPRTDSDINAWLGKGGWVRLLDVPIAAGSTEINVAGLTANSGSVGRPHTVRHDTSGASIANAVGTALAWATTVEDEGGITYDSGTGTFTVPTPGFYAVDAGVTFNGNTAGRRDVKITVDGTIRAWGLSEGTTQFQTVWASGTYWVESTITVLASQTSGAALTLQTSAGTNTLSITRT